MRLDLGGCSLTGETDPERYTVDGLCTANVEVLERGVALPAKERRIADLKDEDLYTYVTLAGTEFLSKQGCYANVFESCVQRSRLNAFDQPSRPGFRRREATERGIRVSGCNSYQQGVYLTRWFLRL